MSPNRRGWFATPPPRRSRHLRSPVELLREPAPMDRHACAATMVRQARLGFDLLPDFVAFAWVRSATNSWATSRFVAHGAEGCRFGCFAVGGDCILHDASCQFSFAAAATLRPVPFLDRLRGLIRLLPRSRFGTLALCSTCCHYALDR